MSNPSPPTLWCCTPIYFDVPSFLKLRSNIQKAFLGSADVGAVKFVAIDDSAGTDPEMQRLKKEQATEAKDLYIIQPPYNLGHQRALVYGLRKALPQIADSDIIVTLDSDGEDRPEDIPRLVEALVGAGSATGSRVVVLARRTSRRTSWMFKLLYFFFKIFFRLLTGMVIRTGNCACYYASSIRAAISHPFFDQCYSSSLVALHFQRYFIPCPRGERYAGRSKMNFWSLLMHGHRMLMPFIDRIAIRLLFFIAALFFLTLALLFIALVYAFIYETLTVSNFSWASLALLGGCILLLVNFLVLFTVVAQSQAISLRGIENE